VKKLDLTNQRFGRLTVIKEDPVPYRAPSGKSTRRWVCLCDCGNQVTVLQNVLTSGHGKSCGCLQREKAASQYNDLTDKRFGKLLVIKRAPLKGKYANGAHNGWLCRCDCGTERVFLAKTLTGGTAKSCGCEIGIQSAERIQPDGLNVLGRYQGTVVSAINPDRKSNKNNTSGVKGVYWSNREQRWIAKIGLKGKTITIGRFQHLKDAEKARKQAEEQYFSPILEQWKEDKAQIERAKA